MVFYPEAKASRLDRVFVFFNATVIGAGDDGGAVAETAQGVRNVVRASRRRFFCVNLFYPSAERVRIQPFLSVG